MNFECITSLQIQLHCRKGGTYPSGKQIEVTPSTIKFIHCAVVHHEREGGVTSSVGYCTHTKAFCSASNHVQSKHRHIRFCDRMNEQTGQRLKRTPFLWSCKDKCFSLQRKILDGSLGFAAGVSWPTELPKSFSIFSETRSLAIVDGVTPVLKRCEKKRRNSQRLF